MSVLGAAIGCADRTHDIPGGKRVIARAGAPWIVVGIDGGEWRVIERLWAQGRLPALRALAERGTQAQLGTRYNSSPVIWTTIATGRRPQEHGIGGFVVPTEHGDVPVYSDLRKVPALWNMLSAVGQRVAVFGWWASWPAEKVNGVVVSDRATLEVPRRVFPEDRLPALERRLADLLTADQRFDVATVAGRRDALMADTAIDLVDEGFDLLLLYFRGADIASHYNWKFVEPERFVDLALSDEEVDAGAQQVFREYEAIDAAIADLVKKTAGMANVLVISDHGFKAEQDGERTRVFLDLDELLVRLGLQVRGAEGVDIALSSFYTFDSPDFAGAKLVRFGGAAGPGQAPRPKERRRLSALLEQALRRVTLPAGGPAFVVREPRSDERRRGADLVVVVSPATISPILLLEPSASAGSSGRRTEPLGGIISEISFLSGTHTTGTDGILIAAGPDIRPGAALEGVRIHDIAPTLLYALGLPVGEDFAGRAWLELFTEQYQRAHPLRKIASWGTRTPGKRAESDSGADLELIRELQSLGYL